jgi:hypothetical protein
MSDNQDTQATGDDGLDWQSKLGGLLSGSDPSQLSPIIGQQGLQNAGKNAILNFGIGLMNAGGWHPYRVTFGQALAQGLGDAQQGYQNSVDGALKNANTVQTMQMNRMSMAQKLMLMQAGAQFLNGQQGAQGGPAPTPQTATASGGAVANPFQGAPQGGAPTPGAGAPAGAGAPPAAQNGAGQAAPPSPTQALGGMPPTAPSVGNPVATAAAANPAIAQALRIKQYMQLVAALDPSNARGVSAALTPSLPELKAMPDGTIQDLHDPSNIGTFHGSLMDNLATLGPDGNVTLRPGVTKALAQKAAAAQQGTNSQTLYDKGFDSSGNPAAVTTVGNIINGAAAGATPAGPNTVNPPLPPGTPPLPPGLPPGMPSGAPQAAAPAAAPSGAKPGAIYGAAPLGAVTSANELAKDNAADYTATQQLANGAADRENTISNMLALANGTTKFGPGWSGRMDTLAAINSKLPPQFQFGNDDVANAQILQKYAAYLGTQYQKSLGGQGTDLGLSTALKGTPNPDMLNQAIREVGPKLQAADLAVNAKANAQAAYVQANNHSTNTLDQFNALWRRNYDPRIYQMQLMQPAARAAFMKSQPDAAALRQKAGFALQNGWIQ